MNFAIAKTMIREQFQRTLPILVLCLGLSTVLCLLQYTGLWWESLGSGADVSPDLEFTGFTIFLVHAIGIMALLYCHSDERDMKVTMPAYLLRLPVRTIDLVIWRMGYGLFCVAVIGIGSSGVHYLFFGAEMEAAFAFWTPFLIGISTFAMLQALAWSIGARGIVMLVLTTPIVLLLARWLVGFELNPEPFDPTRHTAGAILSTLAVSFLVAYVGVRTRRREGFDISRILGALPAIIARDRAVALPPFTSPEEAMRWFEWRRQSRMLPLLVCGASIFFVIIVLTSLDINPSTPRSTVLAAYGEIVAGICFFMLGLTTATFGAYCCFQNQRLQIGPQKTFLFIRPVSTKAIANARLVVALRSVVISMVPLILVCAVAVLLAARSGTSTDPSVLPAFVDKHMGLSGAGIALLLFFGMFAITWCVQWFGNLLAPLAVLGIVSLFQLAVVGNDYHRVEEDYLFGITGLVLFAASAFAGYMAHQRDLVEKKSLYVALAAWPLLAVGFSMLLHWGQYVNNGSSPYELLLHNTSNVLAFAVLPIAPLVTVPLFMHYARHR